MKRTSTQMRSNSYAITISGISLPNTPFTDMTSCAMVLANSHKSVLKSWFSKSLITILGPKSKLKSRPEKRLLRLKINLNSKKPLKLDEINFSGPKRDKNNAMLESKKKRTMNWPRSKQLLKNRKWQKRQL